MGKRRAVFIILHIVAPFVLKKTYGVLRLYITRKDQQIAQRNQRELIHAQIAAAQEKPVEPVHHNWYTRMQRKYEATVQRLALVLPGSHVLEASNGLVAYISAAQLTVFYLFGRYYTLAHRLAKVDYLYASAHRPNSRPQSYEVLGVLLGTQLLVKLGMTVHAAYKKHKEITLQAPGNDTMTNAADPLSSGRPAMSVQLDETYVSHTDQASAPWGHKQPAGVPLDYPDASAPLSPEHLGFPRKLDASDRSRFEAAQAACRAKTTQLEAVADEVLRCTLCMDRRTPEMGNSAVTECGHVFCWDCITGWIKEKPECPLCRQAVQANKLIPIYNL